MSDKPNTVNPKKRKKRDLESTMITIKQNLKPILNKKGTRIKNKPRNLPKKLLPTRIETCLSFGEFYPNLMKRKKSEKIVLKPKHDYKVVVSTNKRKRSTPHKEFSFDDALPIILTQLSTNEGKIPLKQDKQSFIPQDLPSKQARKQNQPCKSLLKVHMSEGQEIVNYKLVSPPHRSLTELTAEDLMRMDEDSLSDEDMMEILTCPSPVWWEEPCEDYKEGGLYLFEAENITRLNPISDEKLEKTNKNVFYANSTNIDMNLKLTNANRVDKMESRTIRIAKLENVLEDIKNKMKNNEINIINHKNINDDIINSYDSSKYKNNDANDQQDREMKNIDTNKNNVNGQEVCKQRKLSSSCSDNSVNEDDFLKNLESIDIPIQKTADINEDLNIVNNASSTNHKNNEHDIAKVFGRTASVFKDKLEKEYQEIYDDPKKFAKRRKPKSAKNINPNQLVSTEKLKESKNNKVKSKRVKKSSQKSTSSKVNKSKSKNGTLVNTDILKRLKPESDDILDVRLIKTPTDTNEIEVWSKLHNFKRHSYKPEYFNDVIDVEDELAFSMIISPSNKTDPLETTKQKTETILIDDDDSDTDTTINITTVEKNADTTSDSIETKNDITANLPTATDVDKKMMKMNSENIIKEDTIKIGNNLDVRLIETSSETNIDKTSKTERVNMVVDESPTIYEIADKHANIGLLKLLPIETLQETLTDDTNSTKETDSNFIQEYSEPIVALLKKPEFINNYEGLNCAENSLGNNKIVAVTKNLPTLILNPTIDSPKSIKSFASVVSENASIESSEGTISDTNIKFIDDYDDKVKSSEEKSQSLQIDDMNKEFVTDNNTDTNSFDDANTMEKDVSVVPGKLNDKNQTVTEETVNNDNIDPKKYIIVKI